MAEDFPLWQPNAETITTTNIYHFMNWLGARFDKKLTNYQELHDFSCNYLTDFWSGLWDYMGVIGDKLGGKPDRPEHIIQDPNRMPHAGFFPYSRLNFAENILYLPERLTLHHRQSRNAKPTDSALFFMDEAGREITLSRDDLLQAVQLTAKGLATAGVGMGSVVAGYLPNCPTAIIAMLATASLGGIWTSCSPDFGVAGVLDRFGQCAPKVLIACDGYQYAGKQIHCLERVIEISNQLPSLTHAIILPFLANAQPPELVAMKKKYTLILWDNFLNNISQNEKTKDVNLQFIHVPFNHPLFIMYSSGTTGVPKCIVHSHGGVLMKFLTEHGLHNDIKLSDRVFFFTTCGWMMWNWLLGALHTGAAIALYDGSPNFPNPAVLWHYAEKVGFTHFGTSAKYVDSLKKLNYQPNQQHQLKNLRMVLTTGSPLLAESFDFIQSFVKANMPIISISGGTDILGCFLGGVPILPVFRGELQCALLGMNVKVFDDKGEELTIHSAINNDGMQYHSDNKADGKGELVCISPFPSMPTGFWHDKNDEKYLAAYFNRFPNIWYHGDFIEKTSHAGYIIHGRSDATLNPSGVRIGTAEIYRQVEQFPEILESLAVGQDWQGDVRVILFLKLQIGLTLTAELQQKIKHALRHNCSPRHVPAVILSVPDLPRTKSGKITELAVRDIVMGRPVKNKEALANPETLAYFSQLPELQP